VDPEPGQSLLKVIDILLVVGDLPNLLIEVPPEFLGTRLVPSERLAESADIDSSAHGQAPTQLLHPGVPGLVFVQVVTHFGQQRVFCIQVFYEFA
jgi:hypothetical protein